VPRLVGVPGQGRPGAQTGRSAPAFPFVATSALEEQLSSVRGLLAITLLMMERRDEREVLHLATTAVSALAPCRAAGVLLSSGEWASGAVIESGTLQRLRRELESCPAEGGPVGLPGEAWAWALPMRARHDLVGHLVVAGSAPPGDDGLVLLRSLAQQTGVAIGNARLHVSKEVANAALARSVAALQHKTAIHDRFTSVALTGGGYQGIARALCELTGLPAGIEDRGGALLAWAAPDDTAPIPAPRPARAWNDLIEQSLRAGRPARGDGRLLAAVRVRHDAVGVLYVIDPDGVAGEDETIALEHGSTVLAIELARLLSVAETELRLGVDVLADLVGGTGVAAAVRRAEALGRDLSRPQRVVIVGVHRSRVDPDVLLHAVRGAMDSMHPPLLMHRGETVVALLEVRSVPIAPASTHWPPDCERRAWVGRLNSGWAESATPRTMWRGR